MDREIRGLIDNYVDRLKATGAIKSISVENAFRSVQRHRLLESIFVEDPLGEHVSGRNHYLRCPIVDDDLEILHHVYSVSGRGILTRLHPPSSTSSPPLVAQMLELLDLQPGMRVLEIGTGTGYSAALTREIVGSRGLVATVENQQDVFEQTRRLLNDIGYESIRVFCGDGFLGAPEGVPFDRIIATVGCPDISPHWLEQLAPDGFLLIPLQHGGRNTNPLMRIQREGEVAIGRVVGWSGFAVIRGELEQRSPWPDIAWDQPLSGTPVEVELPDLEEVNQAHGYLSKHQFHYFLGASDSQAFENQQGIGIWDEPIGSLVITVTEGKMKRVQVRGNLRLGRLSESCVKYQSLGFPPAEAYTSEFRRILKIDESPRIREQSANSWIIPRAFFKQLVSVSGVSAR